VPIAALKYPDGSQQHNWMVYRYCAVIPESANRLRVIHAENFQMMEEIQPCP